MPDPAGINPLVGRVAPPPEVPSFNDAVVTQNNYDTAQAIRKQRIDAAMDMAATQTALQQAQGDIPTALDILGKSGRVNAMAALQKGWDDHQAKAQVLAKGHLEMQAAQSELAAEWAHALIGHPERVPAAKQLLTPEVGQLLGDQYDEGRLQTIADTSKNAAQWHKDAAAALAQAPKDLESAVRLSAGLAANAPDQATWDSIPAYYESIGYKQLGQQVRQQLGNFSPENKARAGQVALTPEQSEQASERTAQQKISQQQADAATQSAAAAMYRAQHPNSGAPGSTPNDPKDIAGAIISGDQPPTLTGLYRNAGPVRAELARSGYDLTKATEDWTATQKYLSTLNGQQQTRLRQAVEFTNSSLDLVDSLAQQWKGSGLKPLNAVNLAAAKQGLLGQPAQSLAVKLDAQIADLQSELGTVYKGGNSSTDESLKLAAKNLQADWAEQTLLDATKQIRQNLAIRSNSLKLGGVAGVPGNTYAPKEPNAPAATGGLTMTSAELASLAKMHNISLEQERANATAAGYVIR